MKEILRRCSGILCAFAVVTSLFLCKTSAAQVSDIVLAAGETTFSVDLEIEESEPFAGIEFGLTLSDESALTFTSFTPSDEIAGAMQTPFVTVDGLHGFGFYTASNAYSGKMTVGTLNFTYSGDADQVIEIVHMLVARLDESGTPVGTTREGVVLTLNISRESTAADEEDEDTDSTSSGGSSSSGSSSSGSSSSGSSSSGSSSGSSSSGTSSTNTSDTITEEDTPLAELYVRSKYFDDVDESWPWAFVEIDTLYEAQVVNGTAEKIYTPQGNIKRGDFMLMLYRAYDLNAESFDNFADVPAGSYYYEAIGVAKARGIAQGNGTNFMPEDPISRQDIMTLLYRTANHLHWDLAAGSVTDLEGFTDTAEISAYATDAVATLVKAGIIQGSENAIHPLSDTTRAEMAVILARVMERF
ncbi:MAG: S-layer homology domain-containing protein [Oscillospiraceae bacterium]|nr:S-layer homology domain-containing protein [Oscillospiraceae bacterium]